MSTPGVEPGLSRPQRDVLTTRRCGLGVGLVKLELARIEVGLARIEVVTPRLPRAQASINERTWGAAGQVRQASPNRGIGADFAHGRGGQEK